MIVKISADQRRGERGYEGAEVRLPANRFALADALQRAQVPEGGGYLLHKFGDCPDFLKMALILCRNQTLEEVNLLALKVSRMDRNQLDTYEGIVLMRKGDDIDHPMTMKELINAAYNLGCYEFRPGVTNDRILGEICLEGDMLEEIEKLPDEAYGLLDESKVGAKKRRSDQGYFTPKGYIYRSSSKEKEIYDGVHLPQKSNRNNGLIAVCLQKELFPSQEEEVWLELPASGQEMQQALQRLDVPSFEHCVIAGCESVIPSMEDWITTDEDVGKLNLLAERLAAFPDNRTMMKYKAILGMEAFPCAGQMLDRMLDIAKNLDCYDYDPVIVTAADYGEYVLQAAGIDTSDRAFSSFDFRDYGERQLQKSGFVSTPYGMVSRNGLPFEQEFTKPRQGMTMA